MKFKAIFILFNIVVAFSFIFVYAMPFLVIGGEYAGRFWLANWPLGLIMVVVLAIIDGLFIANWRLFNLLEAEDWPALADYLEKLVLEKGRRSPRLVRLLANCYLVLADHQAVTALEAKLTDKPKVIASQALLFGMARLLSGDSAKAKAFFADCRQSGKAENRDWLEWYYAFALLLCRDFGEAADVLLQSAKAKDPLIVGLSAFFLAGTAALALPVRRKELEAAAETAIDRIKRKLPTRETWNRETLRAAQEVYIVVLTKPLSGAADRIYR